MSDGCGEERFVPVSDLNASTRAARANRQLQPRLVMWWRSLGLILLGGGRPVVLGIASLSCLLYAGHLGREMTLVMGAVFLASLASSIAGFAFSAICGAMVFHLHDDPVRLVQVMIVCSIANQAAMTWAMRRAIDWRGLSVYLAGGCFGLGLGVWALLHTDRALYVQGLGLFLLLYGTFMLVRRPGVLRIQHPVLDLGAGFLGGVTGGAAGFPGASVTIWCGTKGWDKARQRAMFQPFILIMQVAALLAINGVRGGAAQGIKLADLLFIPPALLGTMIGLGLYGRLTDHQFFRVVNLLLIASGLSYLM